MGLEAKHDLLVEGVVQLYVQISNLSSLKPSTNVDILFSQLVNLCTPPSSIDVRNLSEGVQEIRTRLIRLCGEAEGLLETHFSALLARFPLPLHQLNVFPYYSNYKKLALMEFNILCRNGVALPRLVAFVGSGPLPLTSIVLATHHMPSTEFHNYDLDPVANASARRLLRGHSDLSSRMSFCTANVLKVRDELAEYDVVFLAALVGMERGEKVRVVNHLFKYMAPGAVLLVRSAHGARGFLYPVVDEEDLGGFQVVDVVHPSDEVINSVILARKSK
eukprot:Gb_34325 [translate_table: standard]